MTIFNIHNNYGENIVIFNNEALAYRIAYDIDGVVIRHEINLN
jgi:hypothetical protein